MLGIDVAHLGTMSHGALLDGTEIDLGSETTVPAVHTVSSLSVEVNACTTTTVDPVLFGYENCLVSHPPYPF